MVAYGILRSYFLKESHEKPLAEITVTKFSDEYRQTSNIS